MAFHGVWSFAGFRSTNWLRDAKVSTPHEHFLIVGAIVIAMVLFNYKF
jgi:hypothetical protein